MTDVGNPRNAWEALVLRYADGRTPCNCREAYGNGNGGCPSGCQSNCLRAKREIAVKVLQELSAAPVSSGEPRE